MRAGSKTTRDWLIGVAVGVGAVAAVTITIELIDDVVPVLSLGVLYVFAVLLVAIFWGPLAAVPVAVASMLAFNFFFLPPVYTFTLADRSNWFALAVYVVTAIVVGTLASRYRSGKAEAEQREREAALLADIAADLLRGAQLEEGLQPIEERTATVLGVSSVRIALGDRAHASKHGSPHPLTVEGRTIGVLFTPESEEPTLGDAAPLPPRARVPPRRCARAREARAGGARGRQRCGGATP